MSPSTARWLIRASGMVCIGYCLVGIVLLVVGYALRESAVMGAPAPTSQDQSVLGLFCALLVAGLISGIGILFVQEWARLVSISASILFAVCFLAVVIIPRLRTTFRDAVDLLSFALIVLVPLLYAAMLLTPGIAAIFRSGSRNR